MLGLQSPLQAGLSLVAEGGSYSLVPLLGLLIAVAFVVEHKLKARRLQ